MSYSQTMQRSNLYNVYFAPRGNRRMVELGMQIAQQYLSPFDHIIGIIGDAGAGKSMLIKGMFPGLDLTNDDEGMNIRPLPLLDIEEHGFYTPHTFHLDVRFEAAFTQMHVLADAILEATRQGKRVVIEHFELIYNALGVNADLMIGVGEEIIITRPSLFGPQPQNISDIVFKSIRYRKMAHTLEDLCIFCMGPKYMQDGIRSDVRHGFVLEFDEKPDVDLEKLEVQVGKMIEADYPVSYFDEEHIKIGDELLYCIGPRMHASSTGRIEEFSLVKEFVYNPKTERYLMVGLVGAGRSKLTREFNKIEL